MAVTHPTSLTVVSKGNPLDSRTWSGTTANVCRALAAAGVAVTPLDCTQPPPPRLVELGVKLLGKAYYLNSHFARLGKIERPWRAKWSQACLRQAGPGGKFLHAHALDMPSLPAADGSQQHFLLLDTTWHLWRTFAASVVGVTPRLAADAERLEREYFQRAAHLFSLSAYVKRNLVDHYGIPPERVTVVGTGRGAIKPYDGPKDYRGGTILFVAQNRFEDKGGFRLLEGFRLARQSRPDLQLVIAGREEYLALADPAAGITTHGHLSLDQLQALFDQAALFAMPARFEPWGLVYLEALACRVPVLGLDHHALPEITGDCLYGFCLEQGSASEIAETLVRAFEHPERLADMGAAGQRHCLEHFTWDRMVARILDVVGSRGPG